MTTVARALLFVCLYACMRVCVCVIHFGQQIAQPLQSNRMHCNSIHRTQTFRFRLNGERY